MENSYAGVMEAWKVELIAERAGKAGFRGQDIDEAIQHVIIALQSFQFDPEKANGATETTAFTAAVDHQLAKLRRKETRHRQRLERHLVQSRRTESTPAPDGKPDLAIDVGGAIACLSDVQQKICADLAADKSVNEIARELAVSWHTVKSHIAMIRGHLERANLAPEGSRKAATEPLLLTAEQAAALCHKTDRTWRAWNAAGLVPRPIRIRRSVLWCAAELQAWVAAGCPDRQDWAARKRSA